MDAITSISDLVESLQRRGRYAFTRAEVATALPLSDGALTKGLQRLAGKGRVRMVFMGGQLRGSMASGKDIFRLPAATPAAGGPPPARRPPD